MQFYNCSNLTPQELEPVLQQLASRFVFYCDEVNTDHRFYTKAGFCAVYVRAETLKNHVNYDLIGDSKRRTPNTIKTIYDTYQSVVPFYLTYGNKSFMHDAIFSQHETNMNLYLLLNHLFNVYVHATTLNPIIFIDGDLKQDDCEHLIAILKVLGTQNDELHINNQTIKIDQFVQFIETCTIYTLQQGDKNVKEIGLASCLASHIVYTLHDAPTFNKNWNYQPVWNPKPTKELTLPVIIELNTLKNRCVVKVIEHHKKFTANGIMLPLMDLNNEFWIDEVMDYTTKYLQKFYAHPFRLNLIRLVGDCKFDQSGKLYRYIAPFYHRNSNYDCILKLGEYKKWWNDYIQNLNEPESLNYNDFMQQCLYHQAVINDTKTPVNNFDNSRIIKTK